MDAAPNPRKELMREQLVNAAAEIFAAKGFAATSMADIANTLGLGRSAIYHYFANKEAILRELIEQEVERPSHRLADLAARTDLDPAERLRLAVADGVSRRLAGGARLAVLFRIEADLPADLARMWAASRRHILDSFTRFIDEGVQSGAFRPTDSRVAAFSVLGMMNWTSRWFKPDGRRSAEAVSDLIAGFAVAMLANGAVPESPPVSMEDAIGRLRGTLDDLERLAR
jgi:AcrR family transcriptional regulator